MPDENGKLTEEEYEAMSPSDRAHYDIKGRTGDGFDTEDTESTKVAREAAFGDGGEDAEPDPSSVTTTRSPEPGEGDATVEADASEDEDEDGR